MRKHNPERIRPVLRGKTVWRIKEDRGENVLIASNGGLLLEMTKAKFNRTMNRFK